jgi:hypothetical protein
VVIADLGALIFVSVPLIAWAVIHDHGALDVVRVAPLYAVTFACSDAQNRQLVARLSNTQTPLLTPLFVPCWALLLNTGIGYVLGQPPVPEVAAIIVVAALSFVMYMYYVVRVINAVCDRLSIHCFSKRPVVRVAKVA